MIKGFDSWNVPLSKSLNSMPPRTHSSGLRTQGQSHPITGLQALQGSDYVLSSSTGDAAVNIWSTKAGLTRISALNFKLQACIPPNDSIQRAQLYFLNYGLNELENGVKIYMRTEHRAASTEEKKPEEAEQDHEKGDGELMQAMFDESVALDEAYGDDGSSSLGKLDDLQAEYEQHKEQDQDPDFIEDIFSAEEKGEQLCQQAIEKAKEAKKKAIAEKKEAEKKGGAKEAQKQAPEKPVEPNLEFLWQLKDMGFPEDLGKLALIKVKNESVAAAVEAVVSLQVEQVS
jgi:hypothetical protein